MEFGKTDAVDEASGLLSACSQRGECLIYTAQGDVIGRCVFMLPEIRACCKRGMCVCTSVFDATMFPRNKRVRHECLTVSLFSLALTLHNIYM